MFTFAHPSSVRVFSLIFSFFWGKKFGSNFGFEYLYVPMEIFAFESHFFFPFFLGRIGNKNDKFSVKVM